MSSVITGAFAVGHQSLSQPLSSAEGSRACALTSRFPVPRDWETGSSPPRTGERLGEGVSPRNPLQG
jgi:hypothetical protein